MKFVFSQENKSCHTGTDHLSTRSSTLRWSGPVHGGSKCLPLCLHPLQLFIIYQAGGRQDFFLLTDSHLTPYGIRISFPWNFFFNPAKCSHEYYFCPWKCYKLFWTVPVGGSARPRHFHLAAGTSLRCGRADGVSSSPAPSSPLPSPPASALVWSKKRGHKRKHDHLFGFLSLQLGACLINIIWAGSAQCFLRHLFWVVLSLFIGIKMAQTEDAEDPFRVACQIH